jgi:hypothetical protein
MLRQSRFGDFAPHLPAVGVVLGFGVLACDGGAPVDDQNASVASGGEDPAGPVTESTVFDLDNAAAAPQISSQQYEAATLSLEQELEPGEGTTGLIDTTGSAWRMIEVPAAGNAPDLISTPDGWFALSRRSLGVGKVIGETQSALYRSRDGTNWELVPLDPGHNDLALRSITYGNGTYLMAGRRFGADGRGVFWTSADGEDWEESPQPPLDLAQLLNNVDFAGGQFLAFGFRGLAVSEDAKDWTLLASDILQHGSAAFGNGRYVLAGTGPMMVSEDGLNWTSYPVDCGLPGACITDPSGNVGQSFQLHLLFVDSYFYADQLRSADGIRWEALPGRYPAAYVGGRFIGGGGYQLDSWTLDSPAETLHVIRPSRASVTAEGRELTSVGVLSRDEPLPERVSVAFEDGLTCDTASCVIVGDRMYLVPPAGTPPLTDHVPRDAAGAPLLSTACPVSSMLFCDDYAKRSGCTCDPEAPRSPEYCQDVSHYQCEGAFEHREGEWDVLEVAHAGCDCDAIDPNQPPTLGDSCEESPDVCAPPLECLTIDVPSSALPIAPPQVCTAACTTDDDCPSWEATGFCAGSVQLECSNGSCQPRSCE